MSYSNAAGSRVLRGISIAVLFTVTGLTSCSGGGGSTSTNTTTTTNPATPTVTLTATSTSIAYNASTIIDWSSTNSTSCASSSGTGGTGTTGSFNTGALTATTSYIVTCIGAGGSASQSLTITVAPAVITGFTDAGGGNVTVTSVNALINGSIITISGTTNYDGTYTVSNRTNTSFDIAVPGTFPGNDATGTWQLAGGMISGCTSTGNTGAITLTNVPSRFNGVAPLAVFFDAAGTTTTPSTPRPFHDLEYRWDFGDPAGSPVNGTTWNAGSRTGVSSRNTATGPVAAHVYETPGTYIVALSATDGTNTVSNSCAQIVVQDPDAVFVGTNTICVGATVTPTAGVGGCPLGATPVIQSNFATAINTYTLTGRRVLFKRGDTFTAPTTGSLTRTGPGIVGAYGTGVAPVVQGNATILNLSSTTTATIKDWRVMDLEFDGLGQLGSVGIDTMGGINQVLIFNMNMHDIKDGIKFNDALLTYLFYNGHPEHMMFDEIAIIDSTITPIIDSITGWRVYASAKHLSILGNTLGNMLNNNSMGSHVVRTPYIGKGVIANNTIARSGAAMLAIKMHGPTWCDIGSPAGICVNPDNLLQPLVNYSYLTNTRPVGIHTTTSGYTEQVVVSDNEIIGASSPYLAVLGPQDPFLDERVRDVIVERNWLKAGNNLTQKAIVIHSYETTARNNICDMTGSDSWGACFNPTLYGTGPAQPPDNIRIYNNTAYKGDAFGGSSEFVLADIDTTSTNVTVRNNLAYGPLTVSTIMVKGTGASNLTQSNNSTNTQMKSIFPGWVSATPVAPVDFSLSGGSYAREAGLATVPVFSDFFLTSRPQNSVIDMGAVEGP